MESVEIRNNLRILRQQEGLSISELSRLSTVSEKTIRLLERHYTNSRPETKYKIVNGLNKNIDKLKEYTIDEVFPNGAFFNN